MFDSLLQPAAVPGEESLDYSLRPRILDDYVGQEKIRDNLRIAIQAAQQRKQSLDHILLYGPPGLGKTSLAHVVATEMKGNLRTTAGPALTKIGDLAALLTGLQPHDILFIDEIHRLPRPIEETLYPAMEDHALDIVLGKGPGARSIRLELPPFTLIGATTRAGSLSHPLRDRFGLTYRLDFYSNDELAAILSRSADLLSLTIAPEALVHIASRARRTPRVANRLLRRVRDYCLVYGHTTIDEAAAATALNHLEIDTLGLDQADRTILHLLAHQFAGGPVGLETLAAASGEEAETLEDVIEPYLLRLGFLERTPRGRVLTDIGRTHLSQTSGTF